MSIKLAAFLGNPGPVYTHSRHNVGWLLAERNPILSYATWQRKHKGLFTKVKDACFLKPETYMNVSGTAVQSAAVFLKIQPEEILIVHDELDLALGQVGFKFSGGLNGHNGLRSIKACLGSADFWRLRIGIGRPERGEVIDWVLSDFTAQETPLLERVLEASAAALNSAIEDGPEKLLPEWAKKCIE
ncbi:MAG: aminoacyl-tRNA hydrolase [Treponema sp.]|jgi:PTH1 family peptidyl-tRNA hydrolase|nr:aminoacyl-tRNA hydrolase [Treponema sp.]